MKLSPLFNSLPKRLASLAIIMLALMVPTMTTAATAVTIEGGMGVANKTTGETTYKASTNADYNQIVKLQVYYHNRENPDSGKIAENVRVKIDIPSTPGKVQTQTATISGDNTNTVTSKTTVNLDRDDAYLQYIPGSANWRYNAGTNEKVDIQDKKLSDDIVLGGQGLVLENQKPCYNFAATVTVEARVMVPGTGVDKYVQKASEEKNWATSNKAVPGDKLKYRIAYKNTGNTKAENVTVRDSLPPYMTLVPGSTYVYNAKHPYPNNGYKDDKDAVNKGGIIIGDYMPGTNALVEFEVQLKDAAAFKCGVTKLYNVATAHPADKPEYFNTAITEVTKKCEESPKTPIYTCDEFKLTPGANRTVTAEVTKYTATNGATLKTITYDFGDGSNATRNFGTAVNHTYANNGPFTVTASLLFSVNGKDQVVKSEACAKPVSFTTPVIPTTPGTPETPAELPHTGAGDVVALFAAATLIGAVAHQLIVRRRQTSL